MIDGRYITSSTMAGGNNEALQIADFIINNVRKDRNKK
jgi:thiol:disulfide interchange protein DsbA